MTDRREGMYVLALRSHHARRIYDGLKTWEFRRVHARIPVGALVLIYESGGVGKITGEFTVANVVHGAPDEVVVHEPNEQSRQEAREYLAGAARATALHCRLVWDYSEPIELADVGVPRAPQSYMRVPVTA